MKYVFLGLAIMFEVVGSSSLLASKGFTKLVPSAVSIVSYVICFVFLAQTLKTMPLGVAYAIWSGLGIVLTAMIGVVVFKQSVDTPAMIGMALIIAGVVVMNLFSNTATH